MASRKLVVTVTKLELTRRVATQMGFRVADVEVVIDRMLEIIVERLEQGDDVHFIDFGRFFTKWYAGQKNHRSKYKEKGFISRDTFDPILPHYRVKFTEGKLMEERVAPLNWNPIHTKNLRYSGETGYRKVRYPRRKRTCNTVK